MPRQDYRGEPLKFWFPKTRRPSICDEGKTWACFWVGHQYSDLPLYNHRLFPNTVWTIPIVRWPRVKFKRRTYKLESREVFIERTEFPAGFFKTVEK